MTTELAFIYALTGVFAVYAVARIVRSDKAIRAAIADIEGIKLEALELATGVRTSFKAADGTVMHINRPPHHPMRQQHPNPTPER